MADTRYTGAGRVSASDYKYVMWVGKTKAGKAVKIEIPRAFCRSNPEWKFAEKDDVTASIEFEGVYNDEKLAAGDRTEPWAITHEDGTAAGTGEIVLGVGKFYVGATEEAATAVALTRGGGSFVVEREYREINADGDPGAVEGRIEQEAGRPKLSLTALQWLTRVADLYSGIKNAPLLQFTYTGMYGAGTYPCRNNQTWGAWVSSELNTAGFLIRPGEEQGDPGILTDSENTPIRLSGSSDDILETELIVLGGTYN